MNTTANNSKGSVGRGSPPDNYAEWGGQLTRFIVLTSDPATSPLPQTRCYQTITEINYMISNVPTELLTKPNVFMIFK